MDMLFARVFLNVVLLSCEQIALRQNQIWSSMFVHTWNLEVQELRIKVTTHSSISTVLQCYLVYR